jgi:hypothetical protein
MAFAFRRRYGLPPTDPRFLDATSEDIALDYWAHRLWDDPQLATEIRDPDFDAEVAEMERQAAAGGWDEVMNETY